MRPLHRPMFRYGGPIKEGVMSGIREPQAKHTVGSSIWPQTDGRTHQSKIGTGGKILSKVPGGSKIVSKISSSTKDLFPRIGQWWRNIKPTYRTQPGKVTQNKTIIGNRPDGTPIYGYSGAADKYISQTMPPVSKMSKIRAFAKENPWWTYGGAGVGVSSGVVPTVAGGIADLGWRGVKQVGDLLVWDKIFDQDKWEAERKAKKELEKDLEKKGTGTDTSIFETDKIVTEPRKSDEQIRAERIQKYRDIMDIKGMNKRAAYDSLIDASKLVSESGDFKEDIRSGNLVNQIIQATSKQFDKPAKTKDAIDTLILKGEIEADIASGKAGTYQKNIDAIASNLNISKEDAAKMILNKPLNLREQVTVDIGVSKQPLTHKSLVSSTKKQYPKAQVMLTQDEYEDVVGDDSTGEAFIKQTVTDKLSKDPNAKVAGVYIVGKEVVQVDGAGNTLTLFP